MRARAVGAGVGLRVGPQCGLGIAHDRALELPGLPQLADGGVGIGLAFGEVDGDHVEGRALEQLLALLCVDHVVGRGGHLGQRADQRLVVVQRAQGLDVGHGGATLAVGVGRCKGGVADICPHHVGTCVRNGPRLLPTREGALDAHRAQAHN